MAEERIPRVAMKSAKIENRRPNRLIKAGYGTGYSNRAKHIKAVQP
jgi:hypothetical protein